MEIIDSVCEIPGLNISGTKTVSDHGFQRVRYSASPGTMDLREWVAAVCKTILSRNGIPVEDVGIMVGISVGVSTDGNVTAAPGICHSIQKALDLTNAFVFDAFYTDWCTTLDIANSILLKQQSRFGLIVKAEMFSNFEVDEANGFILPDGVSVILFKASKFSSPVQHFYIEDRTVSEASVSYLPNQDLSNSSMKFQMKWDHDNDAVRSLKSKQLQIINDTRNDTEVMIAENWFPFSDIEYSLPKVNGEENLFLGMHYLPWRIQQEKLCYKGHERSAMALLFNPFLLEYISLTFKI
jgi:3-oxoacyl-[acyl-carrier-protein] synthase III